MAAHALRDTPVNDNVAAALKGLYANGIELIEWGTSLSIRMGVPLIETVSVCFLLLSLPHIRAPESHVSRRRR